MLLQCVLVDVGWAEAEHAGGAKVRQDAAHNGCIPAVGTCQRRRGDRAEQRSGIVVTPVQPRALLRTADQPVRRTLAGRSVARRRSTI